MSNDLSPNLEPQGEPERYFTSGDLDFLESVLADAMSELNRNGLLGGNAEAREADRLRLAAVIMREASLGENDRDALKRAAVQGYS